MHFTVSYNRNCRRKSAICIFEGTLLYLCGFWAHRGKQRLFGASYKVDTVVDIVMSTVSWGTFQWLENR